MGNLLLDSGTVFLSWAGCIWEAAPMRRRDWPTLAVGTFAWLLDTGEGLDYVPRILWGGYVLGNELTARGRGWLTLRPTPHNPADDEIMTLHGESLGRVYVPLRKVGPLALLDLPAPSATCKKGKGRGHA